METNSNTLLSTYIEELSKLRNSFVCESVNHSSSFLKNVNIIILEGQKNFSTTNFDVSTRSSQVQFDNSTLNNNTVFEEKLREDYDYHGALAYIVFILIWYAISVIILINMQTRNNTVYYFENTFDSKDKDVHNVLKNRERNVKRLALGKF